jgi:two-component system, LytTR family, response regulator AlgR
MLPLRVLVAHGDRARLDALAAQVLAQPLLALAAACADVPSLQALLAAGDADLLLLQVELPGGSALDLLARHAAPAPGVLCIARGADEALRAWEMRVLDYLVEPVSSERMAAALRESSLRLAMSSLRGSPDAGRAWDALSAAGVRRWDGAQLAALIRELRGLRTGEPAAPEP